MWIFYLANLELQFLGGCEPHCPTPSTPFVLVGNGQLGIYSGPPPWRCE